jgi:hypothetical protein
MMTGGKITHCPAGHLLKVWSAEAGSCDKCGKFVRDGDLVMDCRCCNYYVCSDCHNGRSSFWVALASFIPDCTADARAPEDAEVVFDHEEDSEAAQVVDPRCNKRTGTAASAATTAATEKAESPKEADSSVKTKTDKSAKPAAENIDLLGDLFSDKPAEPAEVRHRPAEPVDLLGAAEIAAPADLGLLGSTPWEVEDGNGLLGGKVQQVPQRPAAQAARLGAA